MEEGPDFVTPRVSDKTRLYEYFKKDNWWARNTWFPYFVGMLYCGIFLWWILTADLETLLITHKDLVLGLPILVFIGFALLLLILALLKYFLHDRKWKKYLDDWDIRNEDKWSTNIGNLVKEYW